MRISFLLLFLLLWVGVGAQNATQADALFGQRQFNEAAKAYASLLQRQPLDPLFNYRFARCKYELNDFKTAIKHFLAAGNRYPLRDFYLADSYFHVYQFTEALDFFDRYINSQNPNRNFLREAELKSQKAKQALSMMQSVAEVNILDSVIVSRNEFIKHFSISRETGVISQQLLQMPQQGTIDLIHWVNADQNMKFYSDTLQQSTHLFKSIRENDSWSDGVKLPAPINTPSNENYPFVTDGGLTLFFATNSDISIGGYDIVVSRRNTNNDEFQAPVNLGMPFNSIYNDYMMVIDKVNNIGWFVTDRFQPADQVVVYQFEYTGFAPSFVSGVTPAELIEYAQLKRFRAPSTVPTEPLLALTNAVPVQSVTPPLESESVSVQPLEVVKPTQRVPENVPVLGGTSQAIFFIVNDAKIYTNTNQFRSSKALTGWNELQQLQKELRTHNDRLGALRIQFSAIENRVERLRITNEISSLEKLVTRIRVQIEEMEKFVRNEEIMTLLNAQLN